HPPDAPPPPPLSPLSLRDALPISHTLPPEYRGRADEYIEAIAREWLPQLCAQGLIDAVDVFCESIAFSVAQAERLFAAARAQGLERKSTRLNSSHLGISYAVVRLK